MHMENHHAEVFFARHDVVETYHLNYSFMMKTIIETGFYRVHNSGNQQRKTNSNHFVREF